MGLLCAGAAMSVKNRVAPHQLLHFLSCRLDMPVRAPYRTMMRRLGAGGALVASVFTMALMTGTSEFIVTVEIECSCTPFGCLSIALRRVCEA